MYSVAPAKNSLDDAVDPAKRTRAMNISTTLKGTGDYYRRMGRGLNLPHSPIRLCDIPHWLLSPFYTVFATTDPLSVPIANIVICKIPLLPLAIERWGGGCGFLVPKGVHLLLYSQKPGNVSWDNKHSITVL